MQSLEFLCRCTREDPVTLVFRATVAGDHDEYDFLMRKTDARRRCPRDKLFTKALEVGNAHVLNDLLAEDPGIARRWVHDGRSIERCMQRPDGWQTCLEPLIKHHGLVAVHPTRWHEPWPKFTCDQLMTMVRTPGSVPARMVSRLLFTGVALDCPAVIDELIDSTEAVPDGDVRLHLRGDDDDDGGQLTFVSLLMLSAKNHRAGKVFDMLTARFPHVLSILPSLM